MENIKDIFKDFESINLNKYKHPLFKKKLYEFKNIIDPIIKLKPEEKVLLIYENMIEDFILLYSLEPSKEMAEYCKKLFFQAKDFYKYVVSEYFKDSNISDLEKEKINKLEEFMKDMEIDLGED